MKIVLVSTYTHPIALGLRFVSSYLKCAGHAVEMIFMSSARDTAKADFGAAATNAFIERCRTADLVGMSLMTNTFHRACVLTDALRAAGLGVPIVWGGTHPTVAPDESLQIADAICVGEGEGPTLELAERLEAGRDPTGVGSYSFRADGAFGNRRTIHNPVQTLEQGLDDYPFPDYELETHWVIEKGELVPARPDNLRGTLHRFRVETTRGCPYPCTFCNNAALLKVYKGKGSWVRQRSNENIIQEIEKARACFPTIEAVNIVDDLFFVRSEENIADFAMKYGDRVNLPLELDAFPITITEKKVASLTRVPIALISMGIQSGSRDTLKNIYKRPTKIEDIVKGIDLFHRYRIKAEYHYIVSNPYEPEANVIETMRFAASHHRGPAILRIFPLMFYPGTPLYERARQDGLIGTRDEYAYNYMYTGRLQFAKHDYLSTWLRVVLHLRNVGVPRWLCHRLIDWATHRWVRRCIDRRAFMPVAFATYTVLRKLYKNLIYQPFVRPLKYLRRRPRYEEIHPEDEVTLPRNNMAAELKRPAVSRPTAETDSAVGSWAAWTLPKSNQHARQRRERGENKLHLVTPDHAAQSNATSRSLPISPAR
ncbi:MAG: B12-binding domain-containing radical SAM protein [Planctomycetes bacterium]|nr:B12-binding domain-containing radical SAM protein [Planctomycetota bacterium]